MQANKITLDNPQQVYHIPDWNSGDENRRMKFLRDQATSWGSDPRIRTLTAQILRKAGVPARQYEAQAAALLKWVQENVMYLNEPGEILQSPLYTVTRHYGDCDDLALLLASLFQSIRLPWRFVLSGTDANGAKVRWIEGTPLPSGARWAHIYTMVGLHPFRTDTKMKFAEPTLKGAPLGWDVISAMKDPVTRQKFPELYGDIAGPVNIFSEDGKINWKAMWVALGMGVATSVIAGIAMEGLRAGLQDTLGAKKKKIHYPAA